MILEPPNSVRAVPDVDVEAMVGADALDDIHSALAQSDEVWTDLWADYGPGNLTERAVKSLICEEANTIRDAAKEQGTKVTEAELEQRANATKKVQDEIKRHRDRRVEFQGLAEYREALLRRYYRGESKLKAFANLPRG